MFIKGIKAIQLDIVWICVSKIPKLLISNLHHADNIHRQKHARNKKNKKIKNVA